jgi:hypothetical protein
MVALVVKIGGDADSLFEKLFDALKELVRENFFRTDMENCFGIAEAGVPTIEPELNDSKGWAFHTSKGVSQPFRSRRQGFNFLEVLGKVALEDSEVEALDKLLKVANIPSRLPWMVVPQRGDDSAFLENDVTKIAFRSVNRGKQILSKLFTENRITDKEREVLWGEVEALDFLPRQDPPESWQD